MGRADYYKPASFNAVCDRCGFQFKAEELRLDWQGLRVCTANGCFETRQPQDFVKGIAEHITPPWTRPDPEPVYTTFCTPNGRTGIAGYAVAGCWIAAFRDPAFDPNGTHE